MIGSTFIQSCGDAEKFMQVVMSDLVTFLQIS